MAAGESTSQYESEWEETKCYCGKGRSMGESAEFQCAMCSRFYHMDCLISETGPCMPFMTSYQFFCKRCNASGKDDTFVKKQASFTQMCHTAVANLQDKNPDRKFFHKDREIIPFIEKHWESLTTAPRRIKQTWHATIAKTLQKDFDIFTCDEENASNPCYGLVMNDLAQIGPNCEALFKLVSGLTNQSGSYKPSAKASTSEPSVSKGGRGAKRKAANDDSKPAMGRPKKGDVTMSAKITPQGFPPEHPFNKDGYRYILAEPDPHAPNWEEFDQSMEWAGKPIPGYLYRVWMEQEVRLSLNDRAPQLKVSEDRLSVTGEKGYSMIRSTHGVTVGTWYYEITVTDMPADTATRIGFSQSLGNLQAPCGYDKFSYSWRSLKGTAFHQSKGQHFVDAGYGTGDTLGLIIQLPYPDDSADLTPPVYKDKPLVKFKSHLYYEEKDQVQEAEKRLLPTRAGKIIAYKNGVCQGIMFGGIYEGTYYAAVSIYKGATVKVNFGPNFKHPPAEFKFRPLCEAAEDRVIRHAVGDILYHIDQEGQLPEF